MLMTQSNSILAVNDHAFRIIEAADLHESSSWKHLPIISHAIMPRAGGHNAVVATFTEAMDVFSHEMQQLILEAEGSFADLNMLEERLRAVHAVIVGEDSLVSAVKTELLAELWSRLGGNRRGLRGLDRNLEFLQNLGIHRGQALGHVVSALQALETMTEDMEDLRRRIAVLLLASGQIPVAVHMRSIKSGIERLQALRRMNHKWSSLID
jgi:hypothetical protein